MSELDKISISDLYALKKVARFSRGYFECTKEQELYYTNVIHSVEKELQKRMEKIFPKNNDIVITSDSFINQSNN